MIDCCYLAVVLIILKGAESVKQIPSKFVGGGMSGCNSSDNVLHFGLSDAGRGHLHRFSCSVSEK